MALKGQTTPQPKRMRPTARIREKIKVERLLTTASGSLAAKAVEGAEAKAGGREAAGRLAQRVGSRLPIVERLPQMTRKSPANKKNEHALSQRSHRKRKRK